MWDKDDHFGRWVQGICGIAFLALAAFLIFSPPGWQAGSSTYLSWRTAADGGSLYLGYRCLRYALTGRDNINRDNM